MNRILQIAAVTLMNLRSIPARLGASLVVVAGTAGVVAVLVALLAMAKGFEATLQEAGQADRAIILRAGSISELNGSIPLQQAQIIENNPAIRHDAKGALIAGETFVSLNMTRRNGRLASVPLRGVGPMSFTLRPAVKIVAGRNLRFGTDDVIVGVGAEREFPGLSPGSVLHVHGVDWRIVGEFTAGGGVHESEIWADVHAVNSAFHRVGTYSSMTARLTSSDAFPALETSLDKDRRLTVRAWREARYYESQAHGTARLIRVVGAVICFIMATGAVFAALNTMYTAVASRAVEIATLRALGFEATTIVVSVVAESLLLALLGGIAGAILTYGLFSGYTASTISGTYTQVAFAFDVSAGLAMKGILLACGIGSIGAVLPALRAVKIPVTRALRGD